MTKLKRKVLTILILLACFISLVSTHIVITESYSKGIVLNEVA